MGERLKIKDRFVRGGGIFTFLRSTISSQIASWTDMCIRMIFFAFVLKSLDPNIRSNLSVCIGAVCGGIVNCCINYRFTFRASGQSVKAVAVKYLMVWTGSLLLNMFGTTYFAKLLSGWQWLLNLGFSADAIFAAATLTVSLVVSLAWNFVLQRNFVYQRTRFDRYAIAFVDSFIGKKQKKNNN